ncbi:MAG: NHL repeat-containing protein [Nitrososphaeraceae archaeon]
MTNTENLECIQTGDMIIVDSGNQRVQKISGNDLGSIRIWEPNNLGILTEKMDNKDSYDIETRSPDSNTNLNFPQGIAVIDSNSEKLNPSSILVSDTKNHRIMRFNKNDGIFISSWGSFGSGPREFSSPKGLTVDTRNNYIYVADTGNNRIQKFNLDGRYLSMSNKIVSEPFLDKDKLELDSQSSLDIDIHGNIYVADTNHHQVVKISPTSNNITKWGFFGNGPGEFSSPRGISVNHEGKYIYVADTANDRIQKFDKD